MCVCVCTLTGDLLTGLVGRVCVCVYSERRPAHGSCRQSVCVCVCVYSDRRPVHGSCRQSVCVCVL